MPGPHYLAIDALIAAAGAILLAAAPTPNGDMVAAAGAMLGTVIVVLEAREKQRPLLSTAVLLFGSAGCGIIFPGLLMFNVWPDIASHLSWHAWGALGLIFSLGGWGPLRAIVNRVQLSQDRIAQAITEKWLGKSEPAKPAEPPQSPSRDE